MLINTLGIVLKTIKYSDTSLITTIFTRELGALTFMLKGALRMVKKGKGIIFQPGQILDLEIQYRENRNFQFIKDHKLEIIYTDIDYHFIKKSVVLFLIELTKSIVNTNQSNEEIFDLLHDRLIELDQDLVSSNDVSIFYMQECATILGFGITNASRSGNYFDLLNGEFVTTSINKHTLDVHDSDLIYHFSIDKNMSLSIQNRRKLFDIYLTYFELHIPGFPKMKSPEILREIFSK